LNWRHHLVLTISDDKAHGDVEAGFICRQFGNARRFRLSEPGRCLAGYQDVVGGFSGPNWSAGQSRVLIATCLRWGAQKSRQIPILRAALTIKASCVWLEVGGGQTLTMNNLCISPVPFAELSSDARALLFIFAMGAAARYVAQPPKRSELTPLLETIWNRNRLCLSDLADPFRMTALLETELSTMCFAGGVQ